MSLPAREGAAWGGAERALLAAAIQRHGGWDAWLSLPALVVQPKRLSGMLPRLKGFGTTFELPARAEIDAHAGRATFFDYPTPKTTGTFDRGRLTIVDERGAVVESRADGRASFRGWRKMRRWSPVEALYFFGYALAHYHGLPFTLAWSRPLATCRVRHEHRILTGVEVELPLDLHTHSRRQTFYFDEEGLLRRHDYVAEIAGWWARGAHFWREFVTVGGVEMATVRHVVARVGRRATPLVALHADLAIRAGR